MALEDYVREARALAKSFRAQADSIDEHLKELLRLQPAVPSGVPQNGQLVRKPTTWKTADSIERVLEFGAKSMKCAALVKSLVDQNLVGGHDDAQRAQYADLAIRRGLITGYLKEDPDETIHWIAGVRKSRVRKKL